MNNKLASLQWLSAEEHAYEDGAMHGSTKGKRHYTTLVADGNAFPEKRNLKGVKGSNALFYNPTSGLLYSFGRKGSHKVGYKGRNEHVYVSATIHGVHSSHWPVHRCIAYSEGILSRHEFFDARVVVDHLDGDPLNNKPYNLQKMSGANNSRKTLGVWVAKINSQGKPIAVYPSITAAAEHGAVAHKTVLRHIRHQVRSPRWAAVEDLIREGTLSKQEATALLNVE